MSKQSSGNHPDYREHNPRKAKKKNRPFSVYVEYDWLRTGKIRKFRLGRYETREQAEVMLDKCKREVWYQNRKLYIIDETKTPG